MLEPLITCQACQNGPPSKLATRAIWMTRANLMYFVRWCRLNGRKNTFKCYFLCCFWKNDGENRFRFIFYTVSAKQQKNRFKFIISVFFEKTMDIFFQSFFRKTAQKIFFFCLSHLHHRTVVFEV